MEKNRHDVACEFACAVRSAETISTNVLKYNAMKTIVFVKGRLNFSSKSTIAPNVHLMESLLDNWLKNNRTYIHTCKGFFTSLCFQTYFSTALILEGEKT